MNERGEMDIGSCTKWCLPRVIRRLPPVRETGPWKIAEAASTGADNAVRDSFCSPQSGRERHRSLSPFFVPRRERRTRGSASDDFCSPRSGTRKRNSGSGDSSCSRRSGRLETGRKAGCTLGLEEPSVSYLSGRLGQHSRHPLTFDLSGRGHAVQRKRRGHKPLQPEWLNLTRYLLDLQKTTRGRIKSGG